MLRSRRCYAAHLLFMFGRSAHRIAKAMLRVQAPDHRFYYSMAELLLHIFCLKGMSLHRAVEIIALNVFDLHTLQYSELLLSLIHI